MTKLHITHRKIDGKWLPCQDLGCNNFDRAEHNRYIVANHLFCNGYYAIERMLSCLPLSLPLPAWIPIGNLPMVGKKSTKKRLPIEVWKEWNGEWAE